jgi:cytochrome c
VGELPVFAWVPSIGVSQLIRVGGTAFTSWAGDLLIGSLGGRGHGYAVFRARIRDGRVRVVERIPLGFRVRDLVETPGGDIVIWDGIANVHILQPAGHVFGRCAGCHAVNRGFPAHGTGPDLRTVFNRRAGTMPGFAYSEPMKALGARWSPARLDRFLRDPAAAVPGTLMDMPGIADESERREIIRYLREAARQ